MHKEGSLKEVFEEAGVVSKEWFFLNIYKYLNINLLKIYIYKVLKFNFCNIFYDINFI